MRFLNSLKSNVILNILFYISLAMLFSIEAYSGTKTITLNFKENDVKFSKQKDYDIISLPDFGFIRDSLKVGEPMMPQKTIRVLLPAGTEVKSVKIISKIEKKLQGKYFIHPIQYSVPVGENGQRKFVNPKKTIYTLNVNYPGKLVEYVSENYFREYHIADLLVYPIQYKPATGEILLNTEMVVEIEYSTSAKYISTPRLRRDENKENKIKDQLKRLIVNPEDVSYELLKSTQNTQYLTQALSASSAPLATQSLTISSTPSATEGLNVDYLIITSDALVNTFQRLADWKTKKGIVATVKTVSWIYANYSGCDLQEKIRHFIQDAYIKWGTDYVLLGGDIDIIPARINSAQEFSPPTDLYYSAIIPTSDNWNANGDNLFGDGADLTADIWVGRAPIHNNIEANLFINKVFTYERNSLAPSLPAPGYLTTMLSLGGIIFDIYDTSGTFIAPWVGTGIYDKTMVDALPIPAAFTNWKMYEYNVDFDAHYGAKFTRNEVLNAANTINRLNQGYAIVNHVDHGNPQVMTTGNKSGSGAITNGDVTNLTNGNKYSVVISGACSPGAFDYDCIGERFILAQNGGAVAFIGGSRSNWTNLDTDFELFFYSTLFKNDINNIGHTLAYTADLQSDSYERCIMNLLGDPEMPVWTDAPKTLLVSHPTSAQTGQNNFTVTITNLPLGKNALVCLKKGIEDYAACTVTGMGSAVNANFAFTPNTPGTLNVTVTSHNFIPYEDSVAVTQASQAQIYLGSYTIDDDMSGGSSGNGDGLIGAGETIQLPVTLRNGGSTAANTVGATLVAYQRGTTNPDPYITITDGTATFGNIASGGSASCSDGFVFSVSKDCPNEEVVEFMLTITDAVSHTWSEKFCLQVGTPQIQYTAHSVFGNLMAGATDSLLVQLSNYGTSVASGITGTLSSSSTYITSITRNPQSFGDISPNSSNNSQGKYYFTIGSGYPGQPEALTFTLTIQDKYGKIWTHNFDLKKPNTPTGLQFTGYETSIDLNWTPNTDADLKGYNVYRSLTATGTYQKINNRLIEGTSYFKDIGLQIETMYYYKISAVDQSANESDLTNYLETSTTIKYLSGWPINGDDHIFASITLNDINNDGKLEIFTANTSEMGSGNKVFAFDYTGSELYDIDNNVTTVSGFAHENGANFWSTPAIADLDNNPSNGYELVIAGRGKNLYCWHINHINIGKPDLYWTFNLGQSCLGSPVIGDIDGDGYKEVIVMDELGYVHIRKYDGTVYGAEPWKKIVGKIGSYCTPALADIDGDGKLEIIIGGSDDSLHVYRSDGSEKWSFNTGRNNMSSSPVVADIDGDGQYEIIFIAGNWVGPNPGTSSMCNIYVKDKNGSDKTGWIGGKSINSMAGVVFTSPAIGDLDGDGKLDIVVGTGSTVEAWKYNGTSLPGWPKTGFAGSSSSPMIANIDENSGQEVIIGSADHTLHAWHADGTNVKGWPLHTNDIINSSPAIGDIEGDGYNEVVAGSNDQSIYIWDTKGSSGKEWSMFHHDAQHSGWVLVAPTAIAATGITSSSFTAKWKSMSGATKYFLDVSTNSSFTSFISGYNNLDVNNTTNQQVTGLNSHTTYYYRVRAYNGAPSLNSNTITVTTTYPAPTINSPTATNITSSSVTLGATVTSNGGAAITAHGFCWATSVIDVGSQCKNDGAFTPVTFPASFSKIINGLAPSTTYYYEAYATNSGGTAYTSITTFTTAPSTYIISGSVGNPGGGISGVVMNGLPGNPPTSSSGIYTASVPYGWSGTVTPTKAGYTYSPASQTYTNVTSNQVTNYTGTPVYFTISGTVGNPGGGISGVVMNGLPGNPVTNSSGQYSATALIPYGWSGTVTPTKQGFTFSPASQTYTNVTSDQVTNYTGTPVYFTISGSVGNPGGGISGVVMNGLPGNPVTNSSGQYSATALIPYGWSGTVTPTKAGYTFSPASQTFSNVTSDQSAIFTGTLQTFTITICIGNSGGGISEVVLYGLPGNPVTAANGCCTVTVNYGWSGIVTPTKAGYTFSPISLIYSNVTSNQLINITGTLQTFTITCGAGNSGGPISGVTMNGLPGTPSTAANGYCTATVNYGWSGTVTPTKAGYTFSPTSQTYTNVTSNQVTNFTGTPVYFTISGTVGNPGGGISGVVMNGLPGNPVTNSSGQYTATALIPYGWSGTVTPAKPGFTFSPASQTYSNVTSNITTNYNSSLYKRALLDIKVSGLPEEFALSQNVPNPFNQTTTISYQINANCRVSLKVYDIFGREVTTLVDGMKEAGTYTVSFDGLKLTSGIYIARFVANPQDGSVPSVLVKKMTLLK